MIFWRGLQIGLPGIYRNRSLTENFDSDFSIIEGQRIGSPIVPVCSEETLDER